jgi:hypothetical protein
VAPDALNVWRMADGGCIFAGVPNVAISAAATPHQISTHRNTTPRLAIQLLQVSSRARNGTTTIAQASFLRVLAFPLRTHIRKINLCPDQLHSCPPTGKHFSTSKASVDGARRFSDLRKRNKLGVSRDSVESRHLPVSFGLLDAIFSRRHEIPPDMPRTVHWFASKRHEARGGLCPDGYAIAGLKHEQLCRTKDITGNFNLAGDSIDSSLIVDRIERYRRAGTKADVCVKHWARRLCGGRRSEHRAGDDAHDFSLIIYQGQFMSTVMDKIGFGLLIIGREGNPALDAKKPRPN